MFRHQNRIFLDYNNTNAKSEVLRCRLAFKHAVELESAANEKIICNIVKIEREWLDIGRVSQTAS